MRKGQGSAYDKWNIFVVFLTKSIPLPYIYMLVTCTSIIKIGDANLVLGAVTSQ
jgi:hypothetical protein